MPVTLLLKMIPDFKQQISELEQQKQDLEIRLSEQTEKMKGTRSSHDLPIGKFPAAGKCHREVIITLKDLKL